MTSFINTDEVAARVHWARAEKCYQDAERFRRLGMTKSQHRALQAAGREDEIAYMLSTGNEPRRVAC